MDASLLSIDDALTACKSRLQGLVPAEVEKRLQHYGFNSLPEKKKSLWKLFFAQFNDIFVYILLVALVLTIALRLLEGDVFSVDSMIESGVIIAILVLNAVLGFVQEYKAEEAIAALKDLTAPSAHVRRNGKETVIDSKELVPGDIVIVEAGDRINADGRLIHASHLRVNESSLTGESNPQKKQIEKLSVEKTLADRDNMVFAGTLVTEGYGEYIVVSTAHKTAIGQIAALVSETAIPETPLSKRLKNLSKVIGIGVLILCGALGLITLFQGYPLIEIVLLVSSLAVSAVPEGLPAVVTACFALGVRRMTSNNALVRKLGSLETLGSISVICSDKTGTITENRMSVVEHWLENDEEKTLLAKIGASCNHAQLPNIGDPTEIGLLQFADTLQVQRLDIDEEEVPFTSEKKYMQTRHGKKSFIKGAVEVVLKMCTEPYDDAVLKQTHTYTNHGLRVLACAVKEGNTTRLVGIVGLEDPPRQGVKEAIEQAAEAGIHTIMITGDHPDTAKSIGNQVGITGDAMTGQELNKVTEKELKHIVKKVRIFARVSPLHKIAILEALKAQGKIVAMTGDGVNDAPALKGAHVGVAMGKVGTQVAREASSMILTDDHYSTIVKAIAEGRRIYDNIRKFLLYLLRANAGQLIFISVAILLGYPLPFLPIHILWINLMTDGLPALALGLEPAEPDTMQRSPRPPNEGLFAGEWTRFVLYTFAAFGLAFAIFTFEIHQGSTTAHARTVTFTFSILFELLLAFTSRSNKPVWRIGFLSNPWLLGAVLIPIILQFLLLFTPLSMLFQLTWLSRLDWVLILSVAFLGFMLLEAVKLFNGDQKR